MRVSLLPVNAIRDDSGFIMLDALLAVTIAALGLGIILTATQLSRKTGEMGLERREALIRLQVLLEATRRIPSEHQAIDRSFRSVVKVVRVAESRASFCQVSAKLTSLRSHRSYELSGLRWCAPEAYQ